MFINKKNLKYRSYQTDIAIPIETLDEGTNFTKDFIIYKDEELIKVYSRKCDHNGGKLCKIKEKIMCPLHGWEFSPETGSYENIQFTKKEENFFIAENEIVVQHNREVLELPASKNDYNLKIELLSHACLIFKTEEFSFATDPWIEGFAFSSGWWTSQFPPLDWEKKLNDVDFIYISHNHPDHLNQFTLEKVRKDMQFIVPEFQSNSVKKLLNRYGFENITSFDLNSYYQLENTELFFSILKSGDFRDDSGFYFSYGSFTCLSTVDSNDLNFLKLPENVTLFCSNFAGGASGYPLCFDTITEEKKPEIISRNMQGKKVTVTSQIKLCKPKFFFPYAGFFTERAPRDKYVYNLNIKNKTNDLKGPLQSIDVEMLDPLINDSLEFNGGNLIYADQVARAKNHSENPIAFYTKQFSNCYINNDFIENFFRKSEYKDNLVVYFELTNDDFSLTNRYITIDFTDDIKVSFESFDWHSLKALYLNGTKKRLLRIKAREDSFSWAIKNNMPFEDLSIGFQCRIDRVPDVYNAKFWDYFTNEYI